MTNLDEIKTSVANLTPENLAEFRDWFTQFDSEIWDRQIEADAASGRLDALAEKARIATRIRRGLKQAE